MQFWESFKLMMASLSPVSIILRMLIAVTIGALVGIDRRIKNNGAGIRTHALVCMGSALVMMTSQYIMLRFPEADADITRIGSQVVSGIGFLGAGTIMFTGQNRVHGLSTAAGLWACACIGLAIGIGFIEGTIVAALAILVIIRVFNRLDDRVRARSKYFNLYVEFEDADSVRQFTDLLHDQRVSFTGFEMVEGISAEDGPMATLSVELPNTDLRKPFLKSIKNCEGVRYFEIV